MYQEVLGIRRGGGFSHERPQSLDRRAWKMDTNVPPSSQFCFTMDLAWKKIRGRGE